MNGIFDGLQQTEHDMLAMTDKLKDLKQEQTIFCHWLKRLTVFKKCNSNNCGRETGKYVSVSGNVFEITTTTTTAVASTGCCGIAVQS